MAKKLTAKQELFVQEYLVDLNATQAAIRAGYSKKTAKDIACENLAKPYIAEAIAKAKAERMRVVKIDADYVLRQAVKLHERCMQEIPVTEKNENGENVCIGEYKFDAAGANKALEIVGKHVDILAFDNTVKHIGDKDGPINININDTERAARIAQILQTAVKAKDK